MTSITLEMPSIVHEIIDANRDFTGWEDHIRNQNSSLQLTASRAAMSLLLHEYSEQMPFYLDFEQDGEKASIAIGCLSSLSKHDRELVCETTHNQTTNQWRKGRVEILNETQEFVVTEKMKTE